jgi:hypothetical protein
MGGVARSWGRDWDRDWTGYRLVFLIEGVA